MKADVVSPKVHVQLWQRKSYESVHVFRCSVYVFRAAFRCRVYGHAELVRGSIFSYVKYLGKEECKRMHQERMLNVPGVVKIMDLKPNTTTTNSVTLHGEVDGSNCLSTGGKYVDAGGELDDVAIVGYMKIHLSDYWTTIHLKTDTVMFNTGLSCKGSLGYCRDATEGEMFWEMLPDQCDPYPKVDVLYSGEADVHTLEIGEGTKDVLVIEGDDVIGAVVLERAIPFCGRIVRSTSHQRLIISMNKIDFLPTGSRPLTQNIDFSLYINTKIMHLHTRTHAATAQLVREIEYQQCRARYDILQNRLQLVLHQPEMAGIVGDGIEGRYGRVMGETLYVMDCPAVPTVPTTSNTRVLPHIIQPPTVLPNASYRP